DLSGWDAALAPELTPVHVFCRAADAFGTSVEGTTTTILDVTASPTATGTDLSLAAWNADPASAPSPTTIATASVTHDASTFLFAGGYVLAGAGGYAFGYTLSDMSFTGAVLFATSAGDVTAFDATGNFDVAPTPGGFLVNGLGLEGAGASGQAVYHLAPSGPTAAQIVTGIGSSSGSVAITADYALVGGLDDAYVGHVYSVPRAALDAAIAGGAPIATPFEESGAGGRPIGSAFALVNDWIVEPRYDESFAQVALLAHPIEEWSESAGLTVGASFDLTTGPSFTSALQAAEGRALLRFGGGLLLVE
ncbi:MAG: hypothetical protein R3B82_16240, partial [Sandaracinaceae bacterium]